MKRIINAFNINAGTVRASVTMYGSDVVLLNALWDIGGDYLDFLSSYEGQPEETPSDFIGKEEVLRRIDAAPPVRGQRRLGHALSYVCDEVFGMQLYSSGINTLVRPAAPKIIIVLSSGASQDQIPSRLLCSDQILRRSDGDFTIIGLGMGDEGVSSLQNENIQLVFPLTGIPSLLLVGNDVIKQVCLAQIQSCPSGNFDLVYVVDG